MRAISTFIVLVLSTTVALAEAGRLMKVTKKRSFFPMPKEMAFVGYQPNQQEVRAIERRYHLYGPKEATSNERYRLPDPEEMDEKYQLKKMNSAFHIPIPPIRNTRTRKRAIRSSCWFQYYTMCPMESFSQKSLSEQEASSSGFTDTDSDTDTDADFTNSRITQQAVLQALGF